MLHCSRGGPGPVGRPSVVLPVHTRKNQRMRKLLFAAVLVICFCAPGSALAQEPAQPLPYPCITLNEVLSNTEPTRPIKRYVTLNAGQTAGLVAWFNKVPPVTSEKFNYGVLVFHVDGNVGMLLGNDGLMCRGGIIYPGEVQDVLNAISGDPT